MPKVIFQWMPDWVAAHEELLWWAGLLSLSVLILSAILLPVVVVRLPRDYFSKEGQNGKRRFSKRSLSGRLLVAGRNLLGGLLVLVGVVMLLTPGQGLVSIAIGLGLMDFPHKRKVLRRVVGQKHVFRTINRLRRKFKRPPLVPPA